MFAAKVMSKNECFVTPKSFSPNLFFLLTLNVLMIPELLMLTSHVEPFLLLPYRPNETLTGNVSIVILVVKPVDFPTFHDIVIV